MKDVQVGTRELKNRLSEYLRRVKSGQTITVTERGKVIGQIVPINVTLAERLRILSAAGLLEWNGRRMKTYQPKLVNRGQRLMSDLILEDRR